MNLHQPAARPADQLAADKLAVEKFAVGQSVPRSEDPMLLRGQGRYTDDVSLAGQAYAVMVRSRNAHGIIRAIKLDAARKMPGVLAIYTAADLEAYGAAEMRRAAEEPRRHADEKTVARRTGERQSALRRRSCRLRHRRDRNRRQGRSRSGRNRNRGPAGADLRRADAVRNGAPLLYDDVPANVPLDYHYGDTAAVDAAFAKAAHVTRMDLVNSRVVVNAMEPRAAVAAYDGNRFTLYVCSQGVTGMRANIAEALGVDAKAVRILTGQVGGSFGMKGGVFPEYICILHGTRALGRPVKWTDERSGSFFSDSHGRDHECHGRTRVGRRRHASSPSASNALPTWARFSRRWGRSPARSTS